MTMLILTAKFLINYMLTASKSSSSSVTVYVASIDSAIR